MQILPISAIVPTINRGAVLRKTLASLLKQQIIPAEIIIVDASIDASTRNMLQEFDFVPEFASVLRWMSADICGAAAQRNQGMDAAKESIIWFFDDDILFEADCVQRLWQALQSEGQMGGVNAMIINQRYQPPSLISRTLFTLLHGQREPSFAGRVIGPAINLLPEDSDALPEVVPVEWLNTTCTMYRREALPAPPFDSVFTGYSLMEDLALSLRVGRQWRLANARTARIFHDSQSGIHKSDKRIMAAMELINRHFVMTEVLGRRNMSSYLRLLLWEMVQLITCIVGNSSPHNFVQTVAGKWQGVQEIRRISRSTASWGQSL